MSLVCIADPLAFIPRAYRTVAAQSKRAMNCTGTAMKMQTVLLRNGAERRLRNSGGILPAEGDREKKKKKRIEKMC